jgi:hypothetical protein
MPEDMDDTCLSFRELLLTMAFRMFQVMDSGDGGGKYIREGIVRV